MTIDPEGLKKKWQEVRQAEFAEIELRRQKAHLNGAGAAAPASLDPKENLVGLALSGGGIRSASFNLGVLQALVEKNMLRYIDFLSTVSGGGYIGAFLSSLAYRDHLRKLQGNQANTRCHQQPPIGSNPDGSPAEDTKTLGLNSNFLNDTFDFVSRYLIGWFLNFITLFSGLVFACATAAFLWRLLDVPLVADGLIYLSRGHLLEWNRPFLPALFVFGLWVLTWVWSYWSKGSLATARNSGRLLALAGICLLVGVAIWLGTPNMNFTNALLSAYDPARRPLWNGHQDWIWPLAVAWLATLIPFLSPRALLKSGTDTTSPWKGWVFHIAGYGLIIGIPFVVIFFLGHHNISGVANEWKRPLVPTDITDWEKFWRQVRKERDAYERGGPLTPGVLLFNMIVEEGKLKNQTHKLVTALDDDAELYRFRTVKAADQTIDEYYADINIKNQIIEVVNRLLISEEYRTKLELENTLTRMIDRLIKDFERLLMLLRKGNLYGDGKSIAEADLSLVRARIITELKKQPNDENLKNINDKIAILQFRRGIDAAAKEISKPLSKDDLDKLKRYTDLNIADPNQKDPKAIQEANEVKRILEQFDFYNQKKDRQQENPSKRWMDEEFSKSGIGHLLLRLYYPQYLRPIRLVSRPIVIAKDQLTRVWIMLVAGGIFLFLGLIVNFNHTSMHGFYRRRIQRVFLVRHDQVEENKERREILLKDMTNTDEGYPYHILSGCVEIDSGKRGEPAHMAAFQFAKLYCGGPEMDFCKTGSYRKGAMSLSSSAAISGAAISPTRIRYLLLQAVMMIANARLGQWLPNPALNQSSYLSPQFVPFLRILWAKWRGDETLDQPLLFVSDGGHYENLGIDALLDRRCRLIFASDAGADPSFVYFDLANLFAIARRKGIRFVQFHPAPGAAEEDISLASVQIKFKLGDHVALWKIKYPEPSAKDGFCVYLKSSLPTRQPFEVAQYKLWNTDFPHDSTANQFFHEQQFEVYRSLGYQLAKNMLERLQFDEATQADKPIDIDQLLTAGVFA